MRIFDKTRRIYLSKEKEIALFLDELEYYRTNNQYKVKLFGKDIVNIYKNINLQVLLTKICNNRCPFCIENDGYDICNKEIEIYNILSSVLQQYISQNITPVVSITGGEPTLFPGKLLTVLDICKKYNIKFYNVNTNGVNLSYLASTDGFRINLSRHHYELDKIIELFGLDSLYCTPKYLYDNILKARTYIQCVLIKGYIDSINEMKLFMDHYIQKGCIGFSFRGLTKLDTVKDYSKEINWVNNHWVDVFNIANELCNEPDFEFIQQKIGDHYFYEVWKYKGFLVRITYSNFELLREIETKEREQGKIYSRATIINPSGNVYSGWCYDINKLI